MQIDVFCASTFQTAVVPKELALLLSRMALVQVLENISSGLHSGPFYQA